MIPTQEQLFQILKGFRLPETPAAVIRIGSGHINDSFLVSVKPDGSPRYVLQRINHTIFTNVAGLMENIRRVTEHLASKDKFIPLRLIPSVTGPTYHEPGDGTFWRLYNYIPGSHSYDVLSNPGLAREAGKAFGTFQLLTSDLDGSSLVETIPNFHDMPSRMRKFRDAVNADIAARVITSAGEVEFVDARITDMLRIREMLDSGSLPLRVTHNDTKCNNILFDAEDRALCIVDLDTVMPGTILFDYGDAIRTGASRSAEDEQDLSRVGLDLDLFEGYTAGYLSVAREFLVPAELEHLAYSARFMTFLIGLRFLTDHLNGDTYYRIAYPGHNLVRARVQFRMVEEMERYMARMNEIVEKYSHI